MSFKIKRPGDGGATFSVWERLTKGVTAKYVQLKLPELVEINRRLTKEKDLDIKEAERLVRALVDELYKARDKGKPAQLFTADNLKVFNQFWDEDY